MKRIYAIVILAIVLGLFWYAVFALWTSLPGTDEAQANLAQKHYVFYVNDSQRKWIEGAIEMHKISDQVSIEPIDANNFVSNIRLYHYNEIILNGLLVRKIQQEFKDAPELNRMEPPPHTVQPTSPSIRQ